MLHSPRRGVPTVLRTLLATLLAGPALAAAVVPAHAQPPTPLTPGATAATGVLTPPVDTASATPLPRDPRVTVGTLPNGIRFYVRRNAEPKARAELRLVINAGSILEDDDQR